MLLRSWGLCAIWPTYRLCNNKMNMLINFFFRIGLFLWNCPTYDFVSVIFFLVVSLTLCIGINIFLISFEFIVWESPLKNANPSQNPLFLCEWQNWLRVKQIKRSSVHCRSLLKYNLCDDVTLETNYPLSKGKESIFFWSISNHVNKINRVLSFYSSQF